MKILFAVDLTEPPAITQAVVRVIEPLDAELLVLHVLRTPPPGASLFGVDPVTGMEEYELGSYIAYDPAAASEMEQFEQQAFQNFLAERFQRPLQARMDLGDPAENILADAETYNVDLIVMGKRHHSALERLLLGSVVREVTEKTDRPVLLMPIPKD